MTSAYTWLFHFTDYLQIQHELVWSMSTLSMRSVPILSTNTRCQGLAECERDHYRKSTRWGFSRRQNVSMEKSSIAQSTQLYDTQSPSSFVARIICQDFTETSHWRSRGHRHAKPGENVRTKHGIFASSPLCLFCTTLNDSFALHKKHLLTLHSFRQHSRWW